ncbi:hypothetical protein [Catenulispora subtropica]|uniref:Uncharacterized protein n=1 Tax=Catenulispora subtropica TaxID=450798 RepID=A0ABN2S217_9ACTN
MALGLSAASVQDSPAGKQVLDHVAAVAPTVSLAWVDGGYKQSVIEHGATVGIRVDIVRRDPGKSTGIHQLRHHVASLLPAQGMSIAEVGEVLGETVQEVSET